MVTVTGLIIGAAIGAIPAAGLGWIACAWQTRADSDHADQYRTDVVARMDVQLAGLDQMVATSGREQATKPHMAAPAQQPTRPNWPDVNRSGPRHQQAA